MRQPRRAYVWPMHCACSRMPCLVLTAIVVVSSAQLVVQEEPRRPRRRSAERSAVVIEDIQRRVAVAGGNTEGILVVSLSWATPDDLDIHVVVPGGAEISYRSRTAVGGTLDVDMCVQGKKGSPTCTERPVENVVFANMAPAGRYKIYVQNFNFHPNYIDKDMQVARMQEGGKKASRENQELRLSRNRPVLFEVLVKVESNYRLFRGLCTPLGKTHEPSNVQVFEFDYVPSAKSEEDRLVSKFEASSDVAMCADYEQKLLGSGGDGRELPDGRSTSASHGKLKSVDTIGRKGSGPSGLQSAPDSRKSKDQKKSRSKVSKKVAAEERRQVALAAVRAADRSILQSKPGKALRELLMDLGASCRSCLEKSDLVDALRREAGVSDEL